MEAERLGEKKRSVANGWHMDLSVVIEYSGLEDASREVPEPPARQGRRVDRALSAPG